MARVWVSKRNDRDGFFVGWYENGQRCSKKFSTKVKANTFRNRKVADLEDATTTGVMKLSWAELVSRYLDTTHSLAQESQNIIRRTLERFGHIARTPSSTVRWEQHLTNYVAKRRRGFTFGDRHVKKVGDNTIKKDRRTLHAFFQFAVDHGYMAVMPKFPNIKGTQRRPQSFTTEEFKQLLAAEHNPEWRMLIILAVGTGRRKHDLTPLRVGDIDVEHGRIRFDDRKAHVKDDWVDVNARIMQHAVGYMADMPEGRERLFTLKFSNYHWVRLVERAKIRSLNFHHLRGTFEQWGMEAGLSRARVADLAGHTEAVSAKHYGEVRQSRAEAVKAIDFPV